VNENCLYLHRADFFNLLANNAVIKDDYRFTSYTAGSLKLVTVNSVIPNGTSLLKQIYGDEIVISKLLARSDVIVATLIFVKDFCQDLHQF